MLHLLAALFVRGFVYRVTPKYSNLIYIRPVTVRNRCSNQILINEAFLYLPLPLYQSVKR